MSVTPNTPVLDLLRVQPEWQFGDQAFNRVIDDADSKLVGVSHLQSPMHWTEWTPNTAYVKDDVVRITQNKTHQYYRCLTAGTSDATEPINNVTGSIVNDNTVIWEVVSLTESGINGGAIKIWLSGNYYNRGEAVLYGTALYRCKVDHLATNWNADNLYWQEVFASIRWWKPQIYYFVDDTVLQDDIIYKCITAHTSANSFNTVEEANWEVVGGIGGAKEWESGKKYQVGQLVTVNGILYKANTKHTSGATFQADIAYWDLVYATIAEWQSNIYYPLGTMVSYNNIIYKCISAHTSSTSNIYADGANWVLYHNTITDWGTNIYYYGGQIVLYDNKFYKCVTNHLSTTFYADLANWEILFANIQIWQSGYTYKTGDIVSYNNIMYKCITGHVSTTTLYADGVNWVLYHNVLRKWAINDYYYVGQPVLYGDTLYRCTTSHLATDFALEKNNWELIYANIQQWATGRYYKVDSLVLYNDVLYQCITDHLATSFTADRANWKNVNIVTASVFNWQPETYYLENQVVEYNDTLYRNNQTHISSSVDFASDLSYWEVIYASIVLWAANKTYKVGNLVIYENLFYRCIEDNTDTAWVGSRWQYLCGIDTWNSNTYYPYHVLVVYDTKLYRCILPHTSTSNFVATNWELLSGGGSGGSGGYAQVELNNVTADSSNPYVVDIPIASNATHTLAPLDVLKYMPGIYSNAFVLEFNPNDSSKFTYNTKFVKFDGGYMLINQVVPVQLETATPLGSNFVRLSEDIDLTPFKSVESVVCI